MALHVDEARGAISSQGPEELGSLSEAYVERFGEFSGYFLTVLFRPLTVVVPVSAVDAFSAGGC